MRILMGNYTMKSGQIMQKYAKLYKIMQIYAKLCKIIRNYAKLCGKCDLKFKNLGTNKIKWTKLKKKRLTDSAARFFLFDAK